MQCGTGLITKEVGAISKDACLIPAGWGLTSLLQSARIAQLHKLLISTCLLFVVAACSVALASSPRRLALCPRMLASSLLVGA
jgi:hypothetical protein